MSVGEVGSALHGHSPNYSGVVSEIQGILLACVYPFCPLLGSIYRCRALGSPGLSAYEERAFFPGLNEWERQRFKWDPKMSGLVIFASSSTSNVISSREKERKVYSLIS